MSGNAASHPLPLVPGSASRPCPGWDVQIFNDENERVTEPNKLGNIMCKLPLPPGFSLSLWGDDQLFLDKYMKDVPGYYNTGDAG
jgi:propionyl-CoA synthetase